MKEKSVRIKIRKTLKDHGFVVISLVAGPGIPTGTPDLLVIDSASRATLLEVKPPGRYPTKIQRARMDEYRRAGVKCAVVHSDAEALSVLRSEHGQN